MAIQYRIYSGDASGGPVDYSTVLATTASLSIAMSALANNTTTIFAVRTYDTVTGLDDAGTDAQVTIITDGSGLDATNRPYASSSLRALPSPTGATIEWTYPHLIASRQPTGFHVYVTATTISYASVQATVLWATGRGGKFRATIAGLTPGTAYQAAVRAYNASGEEPNTAVIGFTLPAAAPLNVDGLTATVGY